MHKYLSAVFQVSSGQRLNMEIVNDYGQLVGEYSKLDDELWLTTPEDEAEAMTVCSKGLDWNNMSSHVHEHVADLPMSECTGNTITDGGLTSVKNNSSLKYSSENQSGTLSPTSVLQRRPLSIEATFVVKRARSKRCHPARKCSRFRKISDLLQNLNSHRRTTPEQDPQMEVFKKCSHCDSEKTRQWRDGPSGRKTLCNACGIQYKIGLIYANFRPSGTPRFDTSLPKIHPRNNSYPTRFQKKGQKMRIVGSREIDHICARNGGNYGEAIKRKLHKEVVKKCQHCESSTTPQWREGPMGRNTLCNACGVQYQNSRLFPEYRPLKSPTYDPSLHTHLPKKLQEMRMSKIQEEKLAISGNREQPA